MASKNKSTKKQGDKKNASKTTDDIQLEASVGNEERNTSIAQKLDLLLEVVNGLNTRIQEQDERLQKQEERVSLRDVSALPSAHSSPKAKTTPDRVPSFEELKNDSKVQAEVDRRLQAYHNASRVDYTGKSNTAIKSGRFRAGVARIKNPISWPQDFCSVNTGSKQPTYDEMSLEQWVQGIMHCILEQSENRIRENMMIYFTFLMQDAIELSASTARKAHAAVLQELERGKVDWENLEAIEKIKNRHTQIIVQVNKGTSGPGIQTQCCQHFNKGQCRFDNEHMSNNTLYQHYCSYCWKETQKKYDHPMCRCLRIKNAQGGQKNEVVKPKQTEQKV